MNKTVQKLEVEAAQDGMRLDSFLVAALPGASRGAVRRLLEVEGVLVGGRRRKKGAQVRRGDLVEVSGYVQPLTWSPLPDPELKIAIVHKDLDLIAVDKPSGVACHPLRPEELGTVASALVATYPELARVADARREAGLVHRLDTLTSGVLIFARRRRSFRDLRSQMRGDGSAVKTYDALVEGDASHLDVIELPLESRGRRVVVPTVSADSPKGEERTSRTTIRPVRRLESFTLLEVEIGAGHRHQIRAHLAAVGHPIAGDELYGATLSVELGRPFLHARRVHLKSPSTGEPLVVEAPLAAELADFCTTLDNTQGPVELRS